MNDTPLSLAMMTERSISNRFWTFGLADGTLSARNVVLASGGVILHYNSPNEDRWFLDGNVLVLVARDGRHSCRMSLVAGPDPSRMWLEGEHILGGPSGLYLALRETEIVYPVHFRWSTAHEDFAETVPFYFSAGFRTRGVYKPDELVTISHPAFVEPQACLPYGAFISVGAYSYCHGSFSSASKASIGRYCSIAGGARPFGPSHPMERISTSVFSYDPHYVKLAKSYGCDDYEIEPYDQSGPPVTIEHDVWIGEDAIIKGGVTIGTGAVVAAKSVVTRDVLPYEIVAGIPARPVRSRFPQRIANMLLDSQWWTHNFFDLPRPITDPEKFVEALLRKRGDGLITPWAPEKVDLGQALLRVVGKV